MVLFGVSYATVSLSCTLLPFLVAVSGTFQQENLVSGLAVFVAYSAGMGVVLVALTLTVGLARASLLSRFRRALRHVGRISGALLVVAGAYITYYGWYSLAVNDGRDVPAGPVAAMERASDRVVRFFADVGELTLGLTLAVSIAVALLVGLSRRRGRGRLSEGAVESAQGGQHEEHPDRAGAANAMRAACEVADTPPSAAPT